GRLFWLLPLLVVLGGCGGARMQRLTTERFAPLPAHAPVDLYVGQVAPPFVEIAIIETPASHYSDEEMRLQQIEELKKRARRLGANAIQDVRILTKEIKGFTLDERT